MSGQNAPSPAPRSASTGPNGPLPTQATTTPAPPPLVNGVVGANATQSHGGSAPGGGGVGPPPGISAGPGVSSSGPSGGGGGGSTTTTTAPMSQHNLNQIVIEYLAKKGYTKTEAVLRAESANQEAAKELEIKTAAAIGPKVFDAFYRLQSWADDALDLYRPEVQRLLWPIFVYLYLELVNHAHPRDGSRFAAKFGETFRKEHEVDLRSLEKITLPEHLKDENIAKIYSENKYRLTLTNAAFNYFMQFLESLDKAYFGMFIKIIEANLDLRLVDRAADDRFSFASIILRGIEGQDMPAEDEGIPGHRPGNAISSTDPAKGNTLANLKLGKLPMDRETEEDVRAELMDIDLEVPPRGDQPSLVQMHELINIKQEDEDEGPNRAEIPFPAATSRDVAMEVQKIRENRDRLKIEGRTGGIGPGVSVCMYTFHNTHDSINCIDFSGDNKLVAAGMAESYVRVWSMDGSALGPQRGGLPQNSQRLIGHSGPVYGVAFAPSTAKFASNSANTETKWLLSCSADSTIRLWNLDIWQQVVIYKGHVGPVWSVSWGPFGHYFASGGMDKTGRVWMTDKIRQVRLLAGHDNDVEVVSWHPNSMYVFTASCDKTVRMWDMVKGTAVRMFTGHTSPITALACSRHGKYLASADDSGSILLWDLGSGRLIKRMRGHAKGGIWSLSWSVESAVLVSGAADNTVRVWDKGRKDAVVTADQISAFLTKNTPVYTVRMTNMNLALAAGAYLPEQAK
ncbi:hypothetical protein DV735_g1412, partial [Chaetothyriales sp. CBS 134920]